MKLHRRNTNTTTTTILIRTVFLCVLLLPRTTFGFSNNHHYNNNNVVIRNNNNNNKRRRQPITISSRRLFQQQERHNDDDDDNGITLTNESSSELDRLKFGWNDLVTGRAFDGSDVASSLNTPEDIMGIVGHVPLIFESIRTAVTGELNTLGYAVCVISTFLTSLAHFKMTLDTPRDYRAPKLAEYRSVYEFSALYLIPFAWLIWRINTDTFPHQLEVLDPIMSLLFTAITLYGVVYAIVGKQLLDNVNSTQKENYQGVLLPSSKAYQEQAQLYLTGNIAINGLACLFIPFAWTLTLRGTEWWTRVQDLHPNQAAFLGISLLVATVGDVSGNFLLRLKELDLVKSPQSIVVMGILSNFLLLLVPEIVFNGIYSSGVSEIGFYFE